MRALAAVSQPCAFAKMGLAKVMHYQIRGTKSSDVYSCNIFCNRFGGTGVASVEHLLVTPCGSKISFSSVFTQVSLIMLNRYKTKFKILDLGNKLTGKN